MTDLPIDSLEFASLLASRICHDAINPIGAVNNGIEMWQSYDDPQMRELAMESLVSAAKTASARVAFSRLAFGASGSVNAQIDLGEAHKIAIAFFADSKAQLVWDAPRLLLPKNQVKLVLNMLALHTHMIPRGGTLEVRLVMQGEEPQITFVARGDRANMPDHVLALISGHVPEHGLDSHSIQAFYAGALMRSIGHDITVEKEPGLVTLRILPAAATQSALAAAG